MRPRTLTVAALLIAAALAMSVGVSSATSAASPSAKVESDSVAATLERPAPEAKSDSLAKASNIVLEERPSGETVAEMFLERVAELSEQTAPMTTRLAVGMASYYASRFHGRRTASGSVYDETEMTAAHLTLPFGTLLKVTNLTNLKSVIVRVTDRGPYLKSRIVDLSRKAARQIGILNRGVAKVRVEKIEE